MAGIIPEKNKEPKSLNTFLAPIVDELKALWKGVKLMTSQCPGPLTYWGALLLASADLLAVRKLCGFKGHSAHRGVPSVLRSFLGILVRKETILGLTGICCHLVTIAAIGDMQKW